MKTTKEGHNMDQEMSPLQRMQSETTEPLLRNRILISLGGFMIAGFTMWGLFVNLDELIQSDHQAGPLLAAMRIFIPVLFSLMIVYFLGQVRKCKKCGKMIFFWTKEHEEDNK
ncbi:MAG: hypothetical protein HQL54_02360 [Magnetococcales bacterium]|nr:hypothetical protein [Magnetococcales bacterium]